MEIRIKIKIKIGKTKQGLDMLGDGGALLVGGVAFGGQPLGFAGEFAVLADLERHFFAVLQTELGVFLLGDA